MQGYPDGDDKLEGAKLIVGCSIWVVGIAAAIALLNVLVSRCATYDPGVGLTPEVARPPQPQVYNSADPPSVGSRAADSGLSGEEVRADQEVRVLASGSLLAGPDLTDYELDPGAEPTWQGLYAMTVEQWSDPEFLHDAYALPTVGDCQIALTDDAVKAALLNVCAYDLVLVQLGAIRKAQHSAKTRALIDSIVRERANSMAALTQRLDEVSLYKNWSLMDRLFMEWAK